MDLKRTNYSSGTAIEEKVGYSRMVKVGPFVYIGGTTAIQADGTVYGIGDPYGQTKYILDKFIDLLKEVNIGIENVIKVKCYTTDMNCVPEISKAFKELFFDVKPLFTLVGVNRLYLESQLVEFELDAIE